MKLYWEEALINLELAFFATGLSYFVEFEMTTGSHCPPDIGGYCFPNIHTATYRGLPSTYWSSVSGFNIWHFLIDILIYFVIFLVIWMIVRSIIIRYMIKPKSVVQESNTQSDE